MELITENLEVIAASILVFIGLADKIAIVTLKTVRNIMDAWNETFKKD